MERDHVMADTRLEGIPLSLFVIMCALAGLGIAYAVAIIVFNIIKRGHRTIKMTSPNINVVIMMGCCGVYGAMVMLGLDTTIISRRNVEKLIQATIYVIVIGFSVIYGLISAKSWRVFMIFKNLTTNGKMTRDEHLLLGLFVMIIIDLAVLIPWHLVDPITCSRKEISEVFEPENMTDVITEVEVCSSKHQNAWIAVIYSYKILILGLGFFFSWQTRHVTLPALKDSLVIYITTCLVIIMSLVALPLLLVQSTGIVIRYAVGALILWFTTSSTITLLFLNKVLLYRKEVKASQSGSFQFQFTESMKRTQESLRKLAGCLCCGIVSEDKYAQEMLLTEIECLKRTIKDKDLTIRQLNDRLYVGAEKFHEYLKSPTRQHSAHKQLIDDNRYASVSHVNYHNNDPGRRVTYTGDNSTNMSRNVTLDGSSVTRESHISESYTAQRRRLTQQGCQYNPTHRGSNRSEDVNEDDHISGQCLHNYNDAASYHYTNNNHTNDIPVYTIEVHRPTLERSGVNLHSAPNRLQNVGLYHQGCQQLKLSPNFDSAIDSNSPSSSCSGNFLNTQLSCQEQENYVSANIMEAKTRKGIHFDDTRRGSIDLEAIENEVANSNKNCMESFHLENNSNMLEGNNLHVQFRHQPVPSRVIFDDCSIEL